MRRMVTPVHLPVKMPENTPINLTDSQQMPYLGRLARMGPINAIPASSGAAIASTE